MPRVDARKRRGSLLRVTIATTGAGVLLTIAPAWLAFGAAVLLAAWWCRRLERECDATHAVDAIDSIDASDTPDSSGGSAPCDVLGGFAHEQAHLRVRRLEGGLDPVPPQLGGR